MSIIIYPNTKSRLDVFEFEFPIANAGTWYVRHLGVLILKTNYRRRSAGLRAFYTATLLKI